MKLMDQYNVRKYKQPNLKSAHPELPEWATLRPLMSIFFVWIFLGWFFWPVSSFRASSRQILGLSHFQVPDYDMAVNLVAEHADPGHKSAWQEMRAEISTPSLQLTEINYPAVDMGPNKSFVTHGPIELQDLPTHGPLICDFIVYSVFGGDDNTQRAYLNSTIAHFSSQPNHCHFLISRGDSVSKDSETGDIILFKLRAALKLVSFVSQNIIRTSHYDELSANGSDDWGILGVRQIANDNKVPWIVYHDADVFITNKYKTLNDLIDRIKSAGENSEPKIRIEDIDFVIGIDRSCQVSAFPINAGVFVARPTDAFAKLIVLSLLYLGNSSPFGIFEQGSLAYALKKMYNVKFDEVQSVCSGQKNANRDASDFQNKNKFMLAGHVVPNLPQQMTSKLLERNSAKDSFLKIFREEQVYDESRSAAVVGSRWFNSPICSTDASGVKPWDPLRTRRKEIDIPSVTEADWVIWQPGDFMAHSYGCKNPNDSFSSEEILRYSRQRMVKYRDQFAVPSTFDSSVFIETGMI